MINLFGIYFSLDTKPTGQREIRDAWKLFKFPAPREVVSESSFALLHWTFARKVFIAEKQDRNMEKTEKHPTKSWEISIIEFENHIGKKYKVTRRLPNLEVAETKVFRSKEEAKKQFDDWLK